MRSLLCAAAIVIATGHAHAEDVTSYTVPIGGKDTIVYCASIDGRLQPGIVTALGTFRTFQVEIKALKKKLKKLLPGTAKKKQQAKLKKLTAKVRDHLAVCTSGGQPPPTATPKPGAKTPTPGAKPSTPPATSTPSVPVPTPLPPVTTGSLSELPRPVTRDDIEHLYRRAGLGVPPRDAYAFEGQPVAPLVQFFMTDIDEPAVEETARFLLDENPTAPHFPVSKPTDVGLETYALSILLDTKNQFTERLAFLALHDRLSTSSSILTEAGQKYLMLEHLTLLRTVGARAMDYRELVARIGEDPAMMLWLNLDQNKRLSPNENYPRELMELFSLDTVSSSGVKNYTDEDIRQVARAFTGYSVAKSGESWTRVFNQNDFDPGTKTIFKGTSWEGSVTNGRDVVNHIFAAHPNAAQSQAKWLLREYLRDGASQATVDDLGATLKKSNFNLGPALTQLLRSAEFYREENRYAIAKHPVERIVHIVRAMQTVGMPYDIAALRTDLSLLGCRLTAPESVFGCDRAEDLPEGQRLVFSANLITKLTTNDGLFGSKSWGWTKFFPNATPTAGQVVDNFETIFAVRLTAAQETALVSYLNTAKLVTGSIKDEPWNPADPAAVKRKLSGLFRLFAGLPQVHDLH